MDPTAELPSAADALTAPISTTLLLGFRDGEDPAEWGRIRAAQLQAGHDVAFLLVGTNLLATAVIAFMFAAHIAIPILAVWAMVSVAVSVGVAVRRRRGHVRAHDHATGRNLRASAKDGAALAMVWIVPVLLFDIEAGSGGAYGLWLVLSVLMTAAAVAMAPLALATLLFLGMIGGAVAIRLILVGEFAVAGATMLFVGLLALACIGRARAMVQVRAGQIALEERNQTVSMLLREFEENTADWLWETDSARRIVRANPRFAQACGLDVVSINGRPLLAVLAGPTWEDGNFAAGLRTLADKLKMRESFRDLRLPVHVDAEERWWELSASPRFDDRGGFCGFRGVGSDVTEQRASADRIARMARYDTLTGLPNRLMINETLARAMQEAAGWNGRCAFMMIDLDRFKAVNDTLGHPIGDRLLSRVSERLAQLMNAETTCGRLGGDEFAVVVRGVTDTAAVERLAHRIIETLSRPYEVDQHTLHVGASVGLAIGPRDGRTAEMLIRSADLALYKAKDAGRGVYHAYEPALHSQAEERRVLEMALREAVANGEMHLAYQPVVDARSGSLRGFEALLRWTHPKLGSIPPSKFIPLAEEARLIAPIGEWVMRTACEEAARWPGQLRIAVNVSPDQLLTPNFLSVVTSSLAQSGLPPERLELEVTESVFMHEGSGATKVLERVLDLGVRLSLDDFGTGYSSLGYLSRTRFSSIKIDRSFVTAASRGEREAVAIIRAVVALAVSLDMATTAEGVESESEHRMVQDLGCTKVQGFYFGRPLPVEEARLLVGVQREAA
jgi:diguanylate cyclase (GGDEF)-like protein/PAS domain S-box-containing protein